MDRREVLVRGKWMPLAPGETFASLFEKVRRPGEREAMVARVKNELQELSSHVWPGVEVDFLDYTDPDGRRVYGRSLSLLMLKAIRDLMGFITAVAGAVRLGAAARLPLVSPTITPLSRASWPSTDQNS